jgi:hypothetical protein
LIASQFLPDDAYRFASTSVERSERDKFLFAFRHITNNYLRELLKKNILFFEYPLFMGARTSGGAHVDEMTSDCGCRARGRTREPWRSSFPDLAKAAAVLVNFARIACFQFSTTCLQKEYRHELSIY